MSLRLLGPASLVLMLMPQLALAQSDAERGKEAFSVCLTCHEVGEGARNGNGPSLNGILARQAGTISGFNYSDANKRAGEQGLVWTEEKLVEYIKNPAAFMPGNRMAFGGLQEDDDVRDIVAYLKQFSK